MSNIIGLHGASPPLSNGANPDVIELLESTLADARRGEIVAIAIVAVQPNAEIRTLAPPLTHSRHMLIAGASFLLADLIKG